MSDRNNKEFESYVRDIALNEEFCKLDAVSEIHHGITRYEHSMRVARNTFKMCKFFNFENIKDITRAALLHDFYVNADMGEASSAKRLGLHPAIALNNALKYYDLNEIQKDIIVKHMFPVTKSFPKYKESWLVTLVDKTVSAYEMLKYKVPTYAGIYYLFMMELVATNK